MKGKAPLFEGLGEIRVVYFIIEIVAVDNRKVIMTVWPSVRRDSRFTRLHDNADLSRGSRREFDGPCLEEPHYLVWTYSLCRQEPIGSNQTSKLE